MKLSTIRLLILSASERNVKFIKTVSTYHEEYGTSIILLQFLSDSVLNVLFKITEFTHHGVIYTP